MPRLPTILVIGSQAISTRSVGRLSMSDGRSSTEVTCHSPTLAVSGQQFRAPPAPLRLLVHLALGDAAQGAYHGAVHDGRGGGHPGAGRLVHERHELVREPRHRAGDADAADVGTAADPVDPA